MFTSDDEQEPVADNDLSKTQLVNIYSFRIGVVAFWDIKNPLDTFETEFDTSVDQVVHKLSSYNSYSHKFEITTTDQLVDPDGGIDVEDAVVVNSVRQKIEWLDYKEEAISEKHDAIAIICYRGVNTKGEEAYAFCSVRLGRLNRAFALARRGNLYHFPFGRIVESGVGALDNQILEKMFDNWLYSDRKLIVKYNARKAGGG